MLTSWLGLAADFWDHFGGVDVQADVEFYRKHLAEHPGLSLDVGCGTGRLILPYLEAGLAIEGVDPSGDMLDICRRKAAARGLRPVLYQQGLESLTLPQRYRTVFIPCGTFQYITQMTEVRATLLRLRNHVLASGRLIISLFCPYAPGQPFSGDDIGSWRRAQKVLDDGTSLVRLIRTVSVNRAEQIKVDERRYEVHRDGKLLNTQTLVTSERWYGKYEISLLLKEAGFRLDAIKGDYTDQDFDGRHAVLIVLASARDE